MAYDETDDMVGRPMGHGQMAIRPRGMENAPVSELQAKGYRLQWVMTDDDILRKWVLVDKPKVIPVKEDKPKVIPVKEDKPKVVPVKEDKPRPKK